MSNVYVKYVHKFRLHQVYLKKNLILNYAFCKDKKIKRDETSFIRKLITREIFFDNKPLLKMKYIFKQKEFFQLFFFTENFIFEK